MTIEQKFNVALQHYHNDDLMQAQTILKQILREEPNNLKVLNFMGMILYKLMKYESALEFFRKALASSPLNADLHYNIGNVLKDTGRFDEAIIHYQRALQINPEHCESYHNMGNVFQRKKQIDQAIIHYQEALKRNPYLADAYYNLGTIAQSKKFINEAIQFYQKALQIDPNLFEAHYVLGTIYADKGLLDEAIEHYHKALMLNPRLAQAHNGLGIVMQKKNEIDKAIDHYQHAITLMPHCIEAHINMGNVLRDYRFSEGAEYWYRRALSIAPDCTFCYDNLFFLMLYHDWFDATTVFSTHLQFAKQCAEPLSTAIVPYSNLREPNRILKLGYISPDFRKHSVSYFIEPVLALHSKNEFQTFCYANVSRDDEVTERLRQLTGHWRDIEGITDQQVADLIRSDGIDILVDLAGHTANNRLLVFARKPSPVQVTWLGYPATTGLSVIDYKIVDSYTDPTGMTEHLYTEKLIRMPECFLCYQPEAESPDIGPLPFLSVGHITFGSFNNFAKVNHKVLNLWAEILRAVPDSRIILKANSLADKTTAKKVIDILGQTGINVVRIELHGMIPSSRMHLDLYNRIDIALDTYPYHGTTTTCEALWMGVPVITLAGTVHASRVGVSLLSNIGLPELIATTPEEYVAKAIGLARDMDKLQLLRNTLRDRMSQSPLTNAQRFTRILEQCYRDVWKHWCQSSQDIMR